MSRDTRNISCFGFTLYASVHSCFTAIQTLLRNIQLELSVLDEHWTVKYFKVTVVNRALQSLHGGKNYADIIPILNRKNAENLGNYISNVNFVLVRKVKSMGVAVPATVYTPEPHSWDVPLPIWALQPPTSTWDPAFLQQIDPRYRKTRWRRFLKSYFSFLFLCRCILMDYHCNFKWSYQFWKVI